MHQLPSVENVNDIWVLMQQSLSLRSIKCKSMESGEAQQLHFLVKALMIAPQPTNSLRLRSQLQFCAMTCGITQLRMDGGRCAYF